MSTQVKQLRVDKQVLEAHEAATSALKTCREAQGLTVERVEDTLDALEEVSHCFDWGIPLPQRYLPYPNLLSTSHGGPGPLFKVRFRFSTTRREEGAMPASINRTMSCVLVRKSLDEVVPTLINRPPIQHRHTVTLSLLWSSRAIKSVQRVPHE